MSSVANLREFYILQLNMLNMLLVLSELVYLNCITFKPYKGGFSTTPQQNEEKVNRTFLLGNKTVILYFMLYRSFFKNKKMYRESSGKTVCNFVIN